MHSLIRSIPVMFLFPLLQASAKAALPITPDTSSLLLWRLDENSGAFFEDASAANRQGTGYDVAAGQITVGETGVLGNAVKMGGTSGRNFIRSQEIDGDDFADGDFTLQIWVQNPLLTGADGTLGRVIAAQRSATLIDWSLGVTSSGSLLVFGNNGGALSFTSADLTWEEDVWYNIALVADTAGDITTYSLYRTEDGGTSLGALGSFTGYAPGNVGTGGAFSIGGDSSSTIAGRRFGGWLDEVHYSNTARDESYLLATAIPEAKSLLLLAVGGAFLFMHQRRFERRAQRSRHLLNQ